MSKLRSDELVNMEGDGAPSFPQSATTIEPTADNQVATKSYVDLALSAASGNAVSATPPTNPALGSFWTDTSVAPSILKTWNGSMWIEFAGEGTPYTGFLGSPVEVLTPLDGAGVGGPTNYTARTDTISNVDTQFEYGFVTKADLNMTSSSFRISHLLYENGRYVSLSFDDGIRYSDDGMTWNTATHPSGRWYGMTYNGSRFIVVGDNGTIGISTDKNFWQPWSQQLPAGTQHPAGFDFAKIKYFDNLYVGISTVGDLYYSFDLANWNKRDIDHPNEIRDLVDTPYGDFSSRRVITVGSGTTTFYADPVINRATATSSVTAGVITSVTITDGGFGYKVGSNHPVIVESDRTKREDRSYR